MDIKKYKLQIMIVAIVVSLLLFLLGWFILPDNLVMQISIGSSNPTTMPKIIGLGLPTALCAGFAIAYFFKPEQLKYLIGSALGVLIFLLTFLFNL